MESRSFWECLDGAIRHSEPSIHVHLWELRSNSTWTSSISLDSIKVGSVSVPDDKKPQDARLQLQQANGMMAQRNTMIAIPSICHSFPSALGDSTELDRICYSASVLPIVHHRLLLQILQYRCSRSCRCHFRSYLVREGYGVWNPRMIL